MKKRSKTVLAKSVGVTLCSLALCASMTGCSSLTTMMGASTNTNTPQSENRSYMSQVNTIMSELGDNLKGFTDAVSRGDKVSMKTQCDNALKQLDSLSNLQASSDMEEVKAKYNSGAESLKSALTKYVDLYTSGAAITPEALTEIQAQYDAGVTALSEADKLAASKS